MGAGLHAIIPAGGAGTRLWPLSRAGEPKFLLDPTGVGQSLLQQTVTRLRPVTESITVVTGQANAVAVQGQLPELAPANILGEPSPRDSMAAIGLAAAVLQHRHGDVVIGSFAADHVITHPEVLHQAIGAAVAAAQQGKLVTIGIPARHPSTAFGYVQAGEQLRVGEGAGRTASERSTAGEEVATELPAGDALAGCYQARAFAEKPDAAVAAEYLASGEYLWNAGIFVARTTVLLGHLARLLPELHAGLTRLAQAWDTPEQAEKLAEIWPGLQRIAIDHALAEPVAATGGVAVVRPDRISPDTDMGWTDLGDYASLAEILEVNAAAGQPPASANLVLGGEAGQRAASPASPVLLRNAPGALVLDEQAEAGVIAVLGVADAVVVRTPAALLVTTRAHAQEVKEIAGQVGAVFPELA